MAPELAAASPPTSDGKRHVVRLEGCRPVPLGAYLKALGVLRLVSEQADPAARGWWERESFVLETVLDKDGLREFFLAQYEPTPLVGPWGGRSGFFPEPSERSAREALNRIEESNDPRVDEFAAAIKWVRAVLKELGFDKKPSNKADKLKILRACRASLPDGILPWLDTCYVLTDSGLGRKFPPLLGTGGNEGSGSYFSGFAQMVLQCIVDRACDQSLSTALFDVQEVGTKSVQTPGQFNPGAAGGPNASTGFSGQIRLNPWDHLFCLEGSLLFSAAATRRHYQSSTKSYGFPFTVEPTGTGTGKATPGDVDSARAEMWCPLWSRPATAAELLAVFGEGRATIGVAAAADSLEFSRAVATLGVDRGISAFERHGMLKRYGDVVFAVPLGRVRVQRNPLAELVSDLDRFGWLGRLRRLGRTADASARLTNLLRRLENTLFAITRRSGQTPSAVQEVLVVLGEVQRHLATSPAAMDACPPAPVLRLEWAKAADDGSAEFRVALALAGVHARHRESGQEVLSMAGHIAPLRIERPCARSWDPDEGHRVVWGVGGLDENLGRIILRRLLDAETMDLDDLPLHARARAPLSATSGWLAGALSDRRIGELFLGLSLARIPRRTAGCVKHAWPSLAAYAVLKPLFTTHAQLRRTGWLPTKAVTPPPPKEVVRLLKADRPGAALKVGGRALRSRGFGAPLDFGGGPRVPGSRLLSVLVTPISDSDLDRLFRRFFLRGEEQAAEYPSARED